MKFESRFFLRPGNGGVDLDGRQAGGHGPEPVHDFGDLALETLVVRQLEEGLLRHGGRLLHYVLGGEEGINPGLHAVG